jgi:phage tail sheath gpL-like
MSGAQSAAQASPGIIAFAEIPYTWKVPGEYMEVKQAINENATLDFPAAGLVIGQMFSTGVLGAPGATYRINSPSQANALFGVGSIIASMCAAWIKANPYTPLDAIGIADAPGAANASGSIGIFGTATAAGTLPVYIASVRVPVAVNIGDTAATVAANLYAQIELQSQPGNGGLVITGASYTTGASVVNLAAGNAGTLGNQIDVRINAQNGDMTPPGISVVITAMHGGATDPTTTVATALAGISKWYTDVAFAWTDTTNITTLANWLNARYGAMVKLDAHGYVGLGGTYGTALNFAPGCKYLSALPMQNPMTPPWKFAASMAGACCYSSAQAPALQMKTVPLPGIVAPASADVFSPEERETLLLSGLSTYYTDSIGTVYLERVTTTFRTDPGTNIEDFGWFDLQNAKVPTRVRYDWNGYISELYPRNLLAEDGTLAADYAPGVVTPKMLQGSWTGRCAVYEKNGWIQNSAVTAANSTFAIDPNDGDRVNSRQQIQVMGNLMVLAGSLEFISNN